MEVAPRFIAEPAKKVSWADDVSTSSGPHEPLPNTTTYVHPQSSKEQHADLYEQRHLQPEYKYAPSTGYAAAPSYAPPTNYPAVPVSATSTGGWLDFIAANKIFIVVFILAVVVLIYVVYAVHKYFFAEEPGDTSQPLSPQSSTTHSNHHVLPPQRPSNLKTAPNSESPKHSAERSRYENLLSALSNAPKKSNTPLPEPAETLAATTPAATPSPSPEFSPRADNETSANAGSPSIIENISDEDIVVSKNNEAAFEDADDYADDTTNADQMVS